MCDLVFAVGGASVCLPADEQTLVPPDGKKRKNGTRNEETRVHQNDSSGDWRVAVVMGRVVRTMAAALTNRYAWH